MGRRQDPFWDYVEKLGGRFRCNFCGENFAGGISRVKSHLSGLGGRGVKICAKVPEDTQAAAARLALGTPNKKARTIASLTDPQEKHQSAMAQNINEKAAVDNFLAKFIVVNDIVPDVVDAKSFIDFVRAVSEYGPDYKLPSSLALQSKLIPDLGKDVEAYIKTVKESWAKTGCTIMLEVQHGFASIIVYSPKGAVFRGLHDISQRDFDVTKIVSSIIEEIGVENVTQFILAEIVLKTMQPKLCVKYPTLLEVGCAASKIHSLMEDICNSGGWVSDVVGRARLIVECMYEDSAVMSLMKRYMNNGELKHPKFVSKYQMLESVIGNKNQLQQLVASEEWRALDYNQKEGSFEVTDVILSAEFWIELRDLIGVLDPIVPVLRLVEDDGSTAGYLYEAVRRAKEAIRGLSRSNQDKYKPILGLFSMMEATVVTPIISAAAFLNAAYMCHGDFREDPKMKDGINYMLETLVPTEEKQKFTTDLQVYLAKASNVFTALANEMLKTAHPRIWWDYCGDCLPVLKKYAIRILSLPCKCYCNLKPSAFEVAQTRKMKMNEANLHLLDHHVYMTTNAMLMEKFRNLETKCLQPIDLENCHERPNYNDPEQGWGSSQMDASEAFSISSRVEHGTADELNSSLRKRGREQPDDMTSCRDTNGDSEQNEGLNNEGTERDDDNRDDGIGGDSGLSYEENLCSFEGHEENLYLEGFWRTPDEYFYF